MFRDSSNVARNLGNFIPQGPRRPDSVGRYLECHMVSLLAVHTHLVTRPCEKSGESQKRDPRNALWRNQQDQGSDSLSRTVPIPIRTHQRILQRRLWRHLRKVVFKTWTGWANHTVFARTPSPRVLIDDTTITDFLFALEASDRDGDLSISFAIAVCQS